MSNTTATQRQPDFTGGRAQPSGGVVWPAMPKTLSEVDGLVMERLLGTKYFTHFERFNTGHSLPQLTGTIDQTFDTEAARNASLLYEILGGNADDAGVTFLAGGGIRFETAGGAGDAHILLAHLDANQSPLSAVGWNSGNRPLFMANIVSGPDAADIADAVLYGGWKLTNTNVTATDADQAFFRYENGVNGGRWQAVTSVNDTDTATDTGVTVAAAALYRLVIDVDINRVPRYYINDVLVATGPAIRDLATYEFYIGVVDGGGGAARKLDIRNFMVSQLYGA